MRRKKDRFAKMGLPEPLISQSRQKAQPAHGGSDDRDFGRTFGDDARLRPSVAYGGGRGRGSKHVFVAGPTERRPRSAG